MIILDTNVLSEVLRPVPSQTVVSWLSSLEPLSVFTTAVTQAEILYGVEILPAGKRRSSLMAAVEKMFEVEFPERILPFDGTAARAYADIVSKRDAAGRPISEFDAMIAAVTRSRRAVLATRNLSDFEQCGISVVNPWKT